MSQHVSIPINRTEPCSSCKKTLNPGDKGIYEVGSHLAGGRKIYCEDCGKDKLN